ncbi:MAG: ABC transporter ATP-binding protein [Deltaproteobacteria bacterium]|nr:ABC transporter ATP-binding protein [Deltaproteobacteria bacterium]MBW1962572.1 ABC transporter ATP-binding protein [Deltaproteobacteria bacterium]MBW2153946.1 ABC transporter ATP-binding protein [Deltaproteobacteria bacterium]
MVESNESYSVVLESVTKIFENKIRAVDDVSLEIREGEFFSLLGPSGCGKTTTLRLIAGFEEPTSGRVFIKSREVTHVPPHKRDTGMVFQNYALFPHRTVAENVAFGLKMRKLSKEIIEQRVTEALRLVELEGMEQRRPHQLSGGQQQRVALARAIVIEPAVLLCDEPLGALDKKLRQAMQFELKNLQKKIGVTLVYVTHDQEEALTMSDRIAVMEGGKVIQIGHPLEIYNRPGTRFVSNFIGESNIFEGRARVLDGGRLEIISDDGFVIAAQSDKVKDGQIVTVAVRPERVQFVTSEAKADNKLTGEVESVNFLGNSILYRLVLPSGRLILSLMPNRGAVQIRQRGETVCVGWSLSDGVILTS